MTKQFFESFVEKKDGKMLAIASDETIDRMGESLIIDKWDFTNFLKNPVLQLSHNYERPPVGVAKNIQIQGKRILFEPVFHEITQEAREIKKLYEEGIMKAFSVGFVAPKDEKGKYELLEISAVSIPANPNALIMARSYDAKIVKDVSVWVCKTVNGKEECPKKEDILENNKKEEQKIMEIDIEALKKQDEIKFEKAISKSAKCRMKDEAESECRSRKISEMIDEGYEKDQASAVAYKLCAVSCENKAAHKEGDECQMDDGKMGEMHPDENGNMACMKKKEASKEGDACKMDNGEMGTMQMSDEGAMACMPKKIEAKEQPKNADEVLTGMTGMMQEMGAHISDMQSNHSGMMDMMGKMAEMMGEKALKEIKEIKIKSGRVISKKNREKLQEAKQQLQIAVSAIEELLDLSESISSEDIQPAKVGEPKEANVSARKVLRALQTIAKNSNFALNQIKKESK